MAFFVDQELEYDRLRDTAGQLALRRPARPGGVRQDVPVPYLPPLTSPRRTIGRRTFDFDRQVAVMAVVNRTPDSFSDAGRTYLLEDAVAAGLAAAGAGADWVDVGGVPFSPAAPVSEAEESDRVLPVVAALVATTDVVVSVDTRRAGVAERSIAAGAAVINDTSGLADPDLAAVVAASDATLVLTHSRAARRAATGAPEYDDVVAEVTAFLAERVAYALGCGVPEGRLVVDPGHDLDKNTVHSLELTRRLPEVADLGLPLLAAVSRKDFVAEATGLHRADLLAPSLAAAAASVLGGARILRMHEPAPAVAAARLLEAVLGLRTPARLVHNA